MPWFESPWKQALRHGLESKCPVWDGIPGNTGRKQREVRQEGRKPIEGAFSSTLSSWANEDEVHWEL